ncbi:MAG: hypothetical protein WCX97_03915 [Candidatus Magasanikbacteria bacterium]
MSEIITTYMLSEPDQPMPMDREDFYIEQVAEFKATGKPTRAIEIMDLLLFTPDKEIIVQKRSASKNHNPGLIDKAIGGHVTFGDRPDYTVMTETLQELQVPSIVLDNDDNFKRTFILLEKFINNTAIVQFIDTRIYNLVNVFKNGDSATIAKKVDLYLGVYGGPVRPADKEATGIMFYKYDNLLEEIQSTPQMFTDDLKFFLSKYSTEITQFLNQL